MSQVFDAVLKGCGREQKGVSESVWCKVNDEPCLMPEDTPDCPVWIEWGESQNKHSPRT